MSFKDFTNNISKRFGLTKIEFNVMFFISAVFILGLFLEYTKIKLNPISTKQFDYNYQDSLFKALKIANEQKLINEKNVEKIVDSEQELSDFSTNKKDSKKKVVPLGNLRINLNSANVVNLTELPGIGLKTAEKIIELRKLRNGFKNIEEIKDVKGIGNSKFNKIKNYIFIEN